MSASDRVDCRHLKTSVTSHGITTDCYPYCELTEKECRVYEYGKSLTCERREPVNGAWR